MGFVHLAVFLPFDVRQDGTVVRAYQQAHNALQGCSAWLGHLSGPLAPLVSHVQKAHHSRRSARRRRIRISLVTASAQVIHRVHGRAVRVIIIIIMTSKMGLSVRRVLLTPGVSRERFMPVQAML